MEKSLIEKSFGKVNNVLSSAGVEQVNKDSKKISTKCNKYTNKSKVFEKYFVSTIDTYFNSFETYEKYVFGAAKQDNYVKIWQDLDFAKYPIQKTFKTKHSKKKISIYGLGYALGSDKGNVWEYLDKYENVSDILSYIANLYNLNYELVSKTHSKPSKQIGSTNTPKTEYKTVQIDKKENKAYFEKICKELNLPLENPYFSLVQNGFNIAYTDLDKNPIIDNVGRDFERQRYFVPLVDSKGKTKKYNSLAGAGYFPYLTPLAHNQNLLSNSKTLYSTEGEKKALYGVKELNLPFVGIGGIHLGTHTEKRIYFENGIEKEKGIVSTAQFSELTKELIESQKITSYNLLFDSDTFSNLNDKKRALNFFAAVKKQFIAAQKVGIKTFTFSIVNPTNKHDAKGLDDLGLYYSASEIKEKLQANTHHNNLFYHFRLDTKKEPFEALRALKSAFIASSVKKVENEKIEIKGKYIGSQLLDDTNGSFVTSLLSDKFIYGHAPTGLGKSSFIKNDKEKLDLVRFIRQIFGKDWVVLLVSPYNSTSEQQAQENILFTSKTLNSENEKVNPIKRIAAQNGNIDFAVTNFDNVKTAYEVLTNFYQKNVLAVWDEYDTLPFSAGYRAKTIKQVFEVLELAPKSLFISATKANLPLIGNQKVFDLVSLDKKPYNSPTLVFTKEKQRLECSLDFVLKAIRNKNRVILHYNNIEHCLAIKKELESKNIITRICASDGKAETNDNEFFDSIKNAKDFLWNNEIEVIICTSVLERGINIMTNRNVSCIYTNTNPYGYDNRAYSQFIARIRNYDCFEVSSTIIDTNKRSYLPNENLKSEFDFMESLEFATQDVTHHNKQLEKIKIDGHQIKKDRFISKVSQNVLYNSDKDIFEVNILSIMQDYSFFEVQNGSPYFCNPSNILFYEKEKESESLKEKVNEIETTKEKAETNVCELYLNDFYVLLASVEAKTKDKELQSKCNVKCNPNEPIQLTNFELRAAENLLKNHFSISKTVSKLDKNDLENTELKGVLIDKESQTLRKTNDLRKRKEAYQIYFLLTNSDTKGRVRETVRINEYQNIISICSNQIYSLSELLNVCNEKRTIRKRYTKETLLEIVPILMEFEVNRKVENDKKIHYYSFTNEKDFTFEMEKLKE